VNFNWPYPVRPEAASENAVEYDWIFGVISLLTVVFTVAVVILVAWLAVRYRKGSLASRKNPLYHSNLLEMIWTVGPLAIALVIFVWGSVYYIRQRTMPKDAYDVFVIGKQWMWHTQHMNGIRENNELHIPVGRPVKLTMISQDVIHAFYVPEFRAQFQVVPGRYTQMAFTPTKPGTYKMLCAMHCGTKHSEMVGYVHVLSEQDFALWQETGGNREQVVAATMADKGRQVWAEKNCGSCHGAVNNQRAPSLNALFGKSRTFSDGTKAIADLDYIRSSILNPYDNLVAGYEPLMPAYQGQLTEVEVLALTEYIKTLGATGDVPLAPAPGLTAPAPPQATDGQNATDIANKQQSGGAPQFDEASTRR
jgi:cytochrome c oxidase subunit 2